MIGSAAVWLRGIDPGPVSDVDLLTSAADADRILREQDGHRDAASDRFRSIFGRWQVGGVAVEVMGGLKVRADGAWQAVRPVTREPHAVDGATVFVPSRADLARIMRLFGRPKDLVRAAALDGAV